MGAGPRDRVAQLVKALCCCRQARRCYGGARPVGRHQEEAVRGPHGAGDQARPAGVAAGCVAQDSRDLVAPTGRSSVG
jgi:hypothetical protein